MRSLTLRLSLIFSGSLLLVALVWIGALRYQQQLELGIAVRLPLPEQAAAIVELIETTPPERLPVTLKALNSPTLRVSVSAQHPASDSGDIRMPGLTWATRGYMEKMGDRLVEASASTTQPDHPVRLVIGLQDGRFAIIEARGGVLRYIFGMRLALLTLFALAVIGGLSLWLLRRQLRPLAQVVKAVESFGGDTLDARIVETEGALEVRRLVGAFNGMQTRIRALVAGRTRMLAAISHDLGTYLTRLRLRVEYIDDASQRDRAVLDIEAMQSLMDDTLALGRLEQDPVGGEEVDLAALARRYADRVHNDKVSLVFASPAPVRGRASALSRVIDNLVGNALKHAGTAEITVRRIREANQDWAELRVEDRGPGIPAEARELVLEPFYRCDAARNLDVAGFGLGLAIVADIVRRHGGKLALEDRAGGGLSTRVRLPAA